MCLGEKATVAQCQLNNYTCISLLPLPISSPQIFQTLLSRDCLTYSNTEFGSYPVSVYCLFLFKRWGHGKEEHARCLCSLVVLFHHFHLCYILQIMMGTLRTVCVFRHSCVCGCAVCVCVQYCTSFSACNVPWRGAKKRHETSVLTLTCYPHVSTLLVMCSV